MDSTTFARVISARVDLTELELGKVILMLKPKNYLLRSVLPDSKVHLHVKDDQADQWQDDCEHKF